MSDLRVPRSEKFASEKFASLCVLSYERPAFLHRMILSAAENANYPFELIIHDDGSTNPEVYELLHNLQAQGAVSTLITNTPGHNQGQGVALNRMFTLAKGDPIVKLDQDLTFEPNWLARTVNILSHSAYFGSVTKDEPVIGLLGLLHYWHEPVHSDQTRVANWPFWSQHTHILGSAFALTREAWDEFGPFEEHSDAFAEDWDMQNRIHQSGLMAVGLPPSDLCTNHGMGPGPSTIVLDHHGSVTKIHHAPHVFTGVA